MAVLKVIEIMA